MDRQLEGRAAEFFQHQKYAEAADVYTQCLEVAKEQNDRVNILLNRASCYLKQGKFTEAQGDCDEILQEDKTNEKALWKKIKVLCFQGRFQEANVLTTEWIEAEPTNRLALKEQKRLEIVMSALKDQGDEDETPVSGTVQISSDSTISEIRPAPEGREALPQSSPTSNPVPTLPAFSTSPSPTDIKNQSTDDSKDVNIRVESDGSMEKSEEQDTPNPSPSANDKTSPAPTSSHWKQRPPPRGLTSEEYSLCVRFQEIGRCAFGEKCTQAHSLEELVEWKERFDHRRQRLQKARENNVQGNTSIEQLQEKLLGSENAETVITERLDVAKVHCNSDLKVDMSSKKCTHNWMFTVTSRIPLQRVLLLDDTYRSYFFISSVSKGPKKMQKHQNIDTNCQEWVNPDHADANANENVCRIKIVFKADIYGTFRQTVVFDYGSLPVLGQLVQVDSAPPAEGSRFAQELLLNAGNRWDINSVNLVEFQPLPLRKSENEERLKKMYICPHPEKFNLSRALYEPLSKENYRKRMHELLFIEEMEQFGSISRYNVKATLQLVNRFLLIPGTLSTAKYAHDGELFARMKVEDDLSEDSIHGRLILQNCQTAWIMPDNSGADNSEPSDKVYEALIEDKGKNFIFLRISAACVSNLNLSCDQEFKAQIQFQLNRLPVCEMHYGVDKLPSLSLVFPDLTAPPSIPWTPDRQWTNIDSKLNAKQKEAVIGITAPTSLKLPPILLCGPYGTGKTYTLAQAAKHVLKEKDTRILICTHSNSAADLYIKDFLHPYVTAGHPEATPMRIYYRHRWTQTVPDTVLPYCLKGEMGSGENFRLPTEADLEKHRVVVTTLNTSRYLCDLDIKPGFFTHIFLDEAAQSLECESLLPLSLSGETTRIVLAGDHMQLSPDVCSAFVKERDFHRSLLERLYDSYSLDFPCKILLCENYRSHEAIVSLTSELFYDSKLVASGKQPAHESFYPLTFFTAKGEEVQHMNSTGFYNMAEIYEVVDRVEELQKTWPKAWGELCDSSIGIVAPYADQVVRIRSELRKRKMFRVSVERVLNVQGKQFRAILLTAVRTRLTCTDSAMEELLDYGFLSNVKLLNTAITRAQSLVAVVGDPVSLCAVGKCRKVWEHFLKLCDKNKSLHGTNWQQIRLQLDGLEMKRTYVLNPNAPEFIPNQLRHGSRLTPNMFGYSPYNYMYGHKSVHPAYAGGFQPQLIYPYLSVPPYGHGYPMYPAPWMMPQRIFKHLSGGPHRGGKGSRLSPVSRAYGHANQSPPSQRIGTRGASPSDGVRPPPEGEAMSSSDSQMSPPNVKTKPSGRFTNRHPTNGALPYYARGGIPHLIPHPSQIPYGMFVPDDPRFYMLHGGYPSHLGFLPMGPMPYPMPRYMPPFPSGPYAGPGGYHTSQLPHEDQRQSPNSSNRSTPGSFSSGPSRPASSTDLKGYSPSSSPNSFQQVQLLPNVKHAPAHLMNSESPRPDSRNSPDPRGTRNQSPIGITSMSPAGKGIKHPRPVSAYTEHANPGQRGYTVPGPHSQRVKPARGTPGNSLTLHPTDSTVMSRPPLNSQYSEELQTPTQIHDLMRMIEESTQDSPGRQKSECNPLAPEYRAGSEVSRSPGQVISVQGPPLFKTSPGKATSGQGKELKLNISLANTRQNGVQKRHSNQIVKSAHRSDSVTSLSPNQPLPEHSDKPTYAGVLRRPPPSPQPQTPITPAVFPPSTPREQMGNDAMDILRNLNIKASPGTQALYQYFS